MEGRSPSKILLTCPSRRQSQRDGQVKEDFGEAAPPRAPPRKSCKSNTCSNHRASRCLSDDPLQRSSQMQLQPVKISTSTGAIASGATLWGWPCNVRRCALGRASATACAAWLSHGVVAPSITRVGTRIEATRSFGNAKSPLISASVINVRPTPAASRTRSPIVMLLV